MLEEDQCGEKTFATSKTLISGRISIAAFGLDLPPSPGGRTFWRTLEHSLCGGAFISHGPSLAEQSKAQGGGKGA
jgi:hypothetical protein